MTRCSGRRLVATDAAPGCDMACGALWRPVRVWTGPESGGTSSGRQGGSSVPEQQGFERLEGVGGGQPLKDELQVRVRLEAVGTGARDQGEEIGAGAGAEGVVTKEPDAPALSKRTNLVLGGVVVYWGLAVLEVPHEPGPLICSIGERLTEGALRRGAGQQPDPREFEWNPRAFGDFLAVYS